MFCRDVDLHNTNFLNVDPHNKDFLILDPHNEDFADVDPHDEDSRLVVMLIHIVTIFSMWIHTTKMPSLLNQRFC